jgi:hypothetical protein
MIMPLQRFVNTFVDMKRDAGVGFRVAEVWDYLRRLSSPVVTWIGKGAIYSLKSRDGDTGYGEADTGRNVSSTVSGTKSYSRTSSRVGT